MKAGKYIGRARPFADFGVSKNGTDQVSITLETKDGESIRAWLYFSDGAADRSIESLRNCGCTFPGGDITNMEGLGDKECEFVVEEEYHDGVTRPKVKWINALAGRSTMEPEQVNSLRARMKARLLTTAPKAKAVDDSDLPF